MNLRKLEMRDAPFMLEWMHDETVVENLQTDFKGKTIIDCKSFIEASEDISQNLHLAVVSDEDIYMGTVSLKHITEHYAEFAIVVCKEAMGKGYAKYAMEAILQIGFEKIGLEQVYWCVNPENKRAFRFYEKQGYRKFDIMKETSIYHNAILGGYWQEQIANYYWYRTLRKFEGGKERVN